MNTYAKYCPNVYLAKCTEPHEKGDVIIVETRYGKENESIVHNLVKQDAEYYYFPLPAPMGLTPKNVPVTKQNAMSSGLTVPTKKAINTTKQAMKGGSFCRWGNQSRLGITQNVAIAPYLSAIGTGWKSPLMLPRKLKPIANELLTGSPWLILSIFRCPKVLSFLKSNYKKLLSITQDLRMAQFSVNTPTR